MSPSALSFTILAVLAGMLFPTQAAVNTRLATVVGGPLLATLVSFAVGAAVLAIVALCTVRHWPSYAALRQEPSWLFLTGGMLGATYLALNVFLVPRIGAGAMMALAVAGQMLAALVLDTAGLFDLARRELSLGRVAGALLVAIGAVMVRLL